MYYPCKTEVYKMSGGLRSNFALIVVLFILLIICWVQLFFRSLLI
ncbi:YjcZ family sporulation protein [Parageobacillus thermoglucosidasius]